MSNEKLAEALREVLTDINLVACDWCKCHTWCSVEDACKTLAEHEAHAAAPQQAAQDAKDAARYRFAQTHDGFAVCRWDEAAGPERDGEYIPIDDEDVDAAMAKESGQ